MQLKKIKFFSWERITPQATSKIIHSLLITRLDKFFHREIVGDLAWRIENRRSDNARALEESVTKEKGMSVQSSRTAQLFNRGIPPSADCHRHDADILYFMFQRSFR